MPMRGTRNRLGSLVPGPPVTTQGGLSSGLKSLTEATSKVGPSAKLAGTEAKKATTQKAARRIGTPAHATTLSLYELLRPAPEPLRTDHPRSRSEERRVDLGVRR